MGAYVCRHGVKEPADAAAAGLPWCAECEGAPFLTDEDVRALREALRGWHPPGAECARDLMALEVAARRRVEKKLEATRTEIAHRRAAAINNIEGGKTS